MPQSALGLNVLGALHSQNGVLAIYDSEALVRVASSLKCSRPANHVPELVDGFTIHEWAAFGRLKSSIASRTCRENGALKKQVADLTSSSDPLFESDPWLDMKKNVDREAAASDSFDSWSTWQLKKALPLSNVTRAVWADQADLGQMDESQATVTLENQAEFTTASLSDVALSGDKTSQLAALVLTTVLVEPVFGNAAGEELNVQYNLVAPPPMEKGGCSVNPQQVLGVPPQ